MQIWRSGQQVLIEPYWNVKYGDFQHVGCRISRINRTILECKEFSRMSLTLSSFVLIEPYWNVKFNSAGGYWNIY